MQIIHGGSCIEVHDASTQAARAIRTAFTLPNPAYIGAVRSGHTPIGIEKVLRFYTESTGRQGKIYLPAAAAAQLAAITDADVLDLRPEHEQVDFTFAGQLRLYQLAAVAMATSGDHGIVDAPTGSGKTIMGLAAIAERGRRALVVVHSQLLQDQWCDAARRFLGVTPALIGGGNTRDGRRSAPLTVAIINSLAKIAEEVAPDIGHLVVDECHRVAAPAYWRTLERFACRYRLGLSATPYRRDGLDPALQWALGPITTLDRGPLVRAGSVLPAQVEQRRTGFVTEINASDHYQAVIDELVTDPARNAQIIADALAVAQGGLALVLSDRKEHARALAHGINKVSSTGYPIAYVLVGGQRVAERRRYTEQLAAGAVHVICATTQLIGEGFDLPAAQAVLLTTPVKWRGRLLQAIGRVLRPAPGKMHGTVIDYFDDRVPVLLSSGRARAKTYRELAAQEAGS